MNHRRPSGTSIQWTSPRHPDIRHRGPERQPHDTCNNRPRSRADENLDQAAIICPHWRYCEDGRREGDDASVRDEAGIGQVLAVEAGDGGWYRDDLGPAGDPF